MVLSISLFCSVAAAAAVTILGAKYNSNILNCKRQKYLSLRCTGKLTKCSVHIILPMKKKQRKKTRKHTYTSTTTGDKTHIIFAVFILPSYYNCILFCAHIISNRHSHRSFTYLYIWKHLKFSTATNYIFISLIPYCTRFNLNFQQNILRKLLLFFSRCFNVFFNISFIRSSVRVFGFLYV